MNFKLPSRPSSFHHYVTKIIPCARCAKDDSCNFFSEYSKDCSNCNGEGYTLHLIPLTRSLVEAIIYEESES